MVSSINGVKQCKRYKIIKMMSKLDLMVLGYRSAPAVYPVQLHALAFALDI